MLYRTAPVPPLIQELAIKIEKIVIRKVIILGPFLILGIQVRKGPISSSISMKIQHFFK